jgi:hypothetical protein
MPGTPLASLQRGRVARSSQQMPAFGPFVDAVEARCDGLLLADLTPTPTSASPLPGQRPRACYQLRTLYGERRRCSVIRYACAIEATAPLLHRLPH